MHAFNHVITLYHVVYVVLCCIMLYDVLQESIAVNDNAPFVFFTMTSLTSCYVSHCIVKRVNHCGPC